MSAAEWWDVLPYHAKVWIGVVVGVVAASFVVEVVSAFDRIERGDAGRK